MADKINTGEFENKEAAQEERCSYRDIFKMFNQLSKDEKSVLSNLQIGDAYLLLNADVESFQTHIVTIANNIHNLIQYVQALLKLRGLSIDPNGKDCSKILVNDFKKDIETDATIKALDQLLGIGKYLDRCIETSIGCNHKYEV